MKILKLSHGYPPTISGVTLVVQKLSQALVRMGHEVEVITASDKGPEYQTEDQGVKLLRLRSWHNPFWSEGPLPAIGLARLRRAIADFKPDIIHSHENVFLSTQLVRVKNEFDIPMISSCYFLPQYVTHYLQGIPPVNRGVEGFIWRYIIHNLNQYDHVVFSTRTQEESYLQHGLRVPTNAISNGVDTLRYYPSDGKKQEIKEIEARYHLPPRPRVLFVGRLMKDKRIDLLIHAMCTVREQMQAHLLLVGRGDEQAELEALIAKLDLGEHVHFLGYVPERDLPSLYRAVDLFSIASICEVQSIPTLQAAVTGLPIVAVEAAALPELVHDRVNGRLVEPGDPDELGKAILHVLQDPRSSQEMGAASLEIGQQHDENATFQAYEDLYLQLLG